MKERKSAEEHAAEAIVELMKRVHQITSSGNAPMSEEMEQAFAELLGPILIAGQRREYAVQALHDRLNVIEHEKDLLRAQVHEAESQGAQRIANLLVDSLEAKLLVAQVNAALRRAGFEYPLGMRGVHDLVDQYRVACEQWKHGRETIQEISALQETWTSNNVSAVEAMAKIHEITERWKAF
jgi:hypothetical protein